MGEELGREEKGLLPFRFALFVPSPSPFASVILTVDGLNKAC